MQSFNTQELEQIVRIILIFALINGILETAKTVVSWVRYFKNKKTDIFE